MADRPNQAGPERLAEVLSRLFTGRGWGARQDRARVEEAWRAAVGEAAAQSTAAGSIRRGVLEVIVTDAVLLQELAGFEKRRILSELQNALGKTRLSDIRFRLGSVS